MIHKPWSPVVDMELVCAVSSLSWIFMSEIECCSDAWRSMLLLRKAGISPVPVASKVADAYY